MKIQNYNPSSKKALALWLRLVCVFILSTFTVFETKATLLVNPAAEGGFENGPLFSDNGWVVANGSATNQWYLGSTATGLPAGYSGNVAFISNDGGVSNAYTTSSNTNVHVYCDITLPAGETDMTLSFSWSSLGNDPNWDMLMVSVASTSTAIAGANSYPGSGTTANGITGSRVISVYQNIGTKQSATVQIPLAALIGAGVNTCAGSITFRLVFTWKNDGFGTNPPAAFDDVSLISTPSTAPSPSLSPFTINNTLPTGGTNFANFTAAINWLNAATGCGLSNPIIFNVSSGQVFSENTPAISASGSIANRIIFQKSGVLANPEIRPTGTFNSTDFGICISGGDFITFDGININSNNSFDVEYGYLIRNATNANGAKSNIIKNCRISLNRSNFNTTVGILQSSSINYGGGVNASSALGVNSDNQYLDFQVTNCHGGVYLLGGTTALDFNNVVGTALCTSFNIIGDPAVSADIGNSWMQCWGVQAFAQQAVKIFNNKISNVVLNPGSPGFPSSSTNQVDGILIDNNTSGTYNLGTYEVHDNIISGIQTINNQDWDINFPDPNLTRVTGIRINNSSNATSIARVYNNVIYNLNSSVTSPPPARKIVGIFLQSSGSGAGSEMHIDHNTVHLSPVNLVINNTCIETGTVTGPKFLIRNNNFTNFTASQPTAKHYCFVTPGASAIGNTGSVSDFNNLYVVNSGAGTGNGFVGASNASGAIQDRQELATGANFWQQVGVDLNSVSANPLYIDAASANFHVISGSLTSAAINANNGADAGWNAKDLDCNLRSTLSPHDFGAYAYLGPNVDLAVTTLVRPSISSCHGTAEQVVIRIKNFGVSTLNFTTNPATVSVLVGGVGSGNITIIVNTGTLAPGDTRDIIVGTTNTSVSGAYTFASTVSDALALDGIPANNSRSDNVNIQALSVLISGTSTICNGQSAFLSAVPANHAAPVNYTWSPATGLSATTGGSVIASPLTTTNYTVTANDNCLSTAVSTPFTITVNPKPIISVTPTSALICGSEDATKTPANYSLVASGNSTSYSWFPSSGLSSATGSSVTASPYSTTSYVVTGTIAATGCTNSATSVVTVGPKLQLTATATPADVCAGGTSQLNVTASSLQTVYAVSSIPYNPTPIGLSAGTVDGDVTFAGPSGDDNVQSYSLGFAFNFFGITYTNFGISTNGNIQLGNGSGTVNNPAYSSYWVPDVIPNQFNANAYVGAPWSDYNTGYPGGPNNNITWGVRGTAPNRQLVVSYNNVGSYPGGSNAQVTTEIILYETTNVVEVHVFSYSNGSATFPNTKTIGIENAAGTAGYAAPGREQFTGEITVPEAWRFTPSLAAGPAVTPVVSWTPNTYLNATNIVNPVASAVNSTVNYTVSATSPEGCVASAPLQLRSGTLSANISSDDAVSCQGQTVTLTANVTSGAGPYGYLWSPGGQTTKSISIAPNTVGANPYSVVVTGPCSGGGATTTANFVQTVELTPTLNLNAGYSTMCYPSVTPISLTASGNGVSYVWSPATGLNATTGASVQVSSLSNSVNYTVVSTLGNCSATKTSYVKVPGPLYVDATANPDAICLGTTSLLSAATATTASYTADIETVSLISESGTVTTLNNTTPVTAGTFNNGYWQVALPFRASFFDQGYNNIYIGTNGYVSFPQGYTVSTPTEIPSATSPNGAIFLAWKDWNLTSSGSVKYFTSGTAPNRVFVIKYVNVPPASGSGLLNGQIELYENGSVYLVLISTDGLSTKTVGIESADGSNFRSFSSFNGIPWTISTPQLLRMRADGGIFSYAWSPSLGVFDAFAQSTETVNLSALPANYSVLVTDSSGCTKSDAVTIIEGTEMNVVITTPDATPCINESITLSVQIFGGGAPYTFQWEDNNGLLPFTTQSITVTPALGANTYFVTVNDACTGIPAEGSISITTNPLPSLTVTPSLAATAGGGVACGTDSVSLVASGSSLSYVWSPATNLNKTSGSTVKSRPSTFNVPITYTVTGTDANQCSRSVSIPVLRAFSINLAASATPSAVCTGGNSQLLALASLNATNYDVNSIDYSSRYTGALDNSVFALFDENNETIDLPFDFKFYGNTFNAVTIHSNGQVLMGGNRFDANFVYEPPFPGIPSSNQPNNWFGYWSDLNVLEDGSSTSGITWDIIGSAPNRKLVVRFTNVTYYSEDPNNTFQYELTETTNTMDIFMTDNSTSSSLNREIGIENSNGTVGLAAPNRNFGTWETSNEAWRFEIPTGGLTYQWTPSTFLTSTTIKDPVAQNVTSSQAYSVTVTSADGCKATAATPVTRSALSVASITAADLTVCQDTLIRLTANVIGGGQPYTFSWREDGVPVGTNSSTLEIAAGSAAVHNYSVSVTDICSSPAATNFIDITVIARPVFTVTSSNDICESGSAELTATGASSYSWTPENGTLSAYTGSTVTAAPTFTTAYNVIGLSSVTGCAATVAITQFVHLLPVADPTATPNPILLNANTQLNAMATQNSNYGYTVVPAAYGSRDLSPVSGIGTALFDEGNISVPLGFNFNYYGITYTGITIHANGQVLMGTGNSSANGWYSPPSSGIPSTDPPNNWVGYWADQYVESSGLITYGVVGSAPNRKLIVRFNSVNYYFQDPSNTFQTELHEGSNAIYVFMTNNSTSSTLTRQIGIEDASGSQGIAAPNRNAGTWTASNEGWKFAPISFGTPVYTYSWSPSTYLDNTTIENPFATSVGGVTEYTVSVTNTTTGCDAAPATIQVLAGVPLTITASSLVNTICAGTTATLNATAGGGGVPYFFEWFVGNTSVGTGASFVVAPEVTTTYTVKVTDVGNSTLESAPFTINVIPLPDVFVTPPGGSICNSNTGITLTASGNSNSYEWFGEGLSSEFGSVIVASPPSTSLVTVTGTRVSGGIPCSNSATVTIHKAELGANATSTPYNICRGEDANLNVSGSDFLQSYSVASLPFSDMDNSPLANPGPEGDEGDVTADLGFGFRYFGNTYTQVTIHANGQILMGGSNTSADFWYSPPFNFPDPFGPNNWVGFWSDLNAYEAPEVPNITWDVVGSAPSRKFIARWSAVNYYFADSALSYQIELNETSNLIDVFLVSTEGSFNSRLLGLVNATGTVGTTPPGRSTGNWEASNEAWRFTPPLGVFNYSWSPTTFLTNSATSNPVAQAVNTTITYTATATDPISGCSITDTAIVKIIPEPRLDISGPAGACAGLTTNLTFNFTGTAPFNYTYTDGITTFGPLVAASNSVTVGVTPPGIAGEVFTYTPLSVSDANCQGTGGGSHTLLVVPLPDLSGVTLTSNKPYNLVCSGDNITLSLDGITNKTLGYQGQWKWYRGGCSTSGGGVLIASGVNNIKVSPTVNTTYYVRAEGTCGNTSCLSIAVLVSTNGLNGSPNVTYSPAIAYAGLTDSVVVAPIAGAYYYRWTNGGNSQVLFDGHPAPYTTTSNKVMVTFVSGATNGNGIGNYHLSFFAANGCGRSNHSNIQIRSSVAAPAVINGPNVACTGQTRTYSIPSITGAKTYEWDLTSGNGTITGNGTTTVTITFSALPATLCVHGVSAFNSDGPDLCMNITTNILASTAVSGDTLPCPGSSSVYTADSVVGATSYIWTTTVPGASVVGTGRSATVTFPSGSFSGAVCVKANSGCSISPITCLNIVNGAPAPVGTITGPVNGLCAVTSVNFQVPSTGATLYSWAAPAGASIAFGQGTNSVLVDFASGFAGGSITVIANNACGTTNGALPVSGATLPPTITPSAPSACAFESVGYTAAASGATGYAWIVDTAQGTIATTSANGDFIIVDWITNGGLVTAVATNSCGTSAPGSIVTPSGTCRVSGDAVLINTLRASVFPNPSQGQLTLQYNSPEKADYLLKVTDLTGRLIVNKSLSGMQGLNRHELDLSALAKGMYKLSLENASGESIVIKVVIE